MRKLEIIGGIVVALLGIGCFYLVFGACFSEVPLKVQAEEINYPYGAAIVLVFLCFCLGVVLVCLGIELATEFYLMDSIENFSDNWPNFYRPILKEHLSNVFEHLEKTLWVFSLN